MRSILLCLLLAFSASSALAAAPTPSGDPVVIGVVYNLTGAMASIDGPGLTGMKLAAARINREGGVLGRPLVLEVRDGGSDLGRCLAAASELAGLKVSAMAGLNDSDFALVAGQVSAQARIPFVTAGATLPSLPRLLGEYFFMACFGDDAQARAVAKFALRRQGMGSMLVLADRGSAYALALASFFTKAYRARGGAIPARVSFTPASPEPLGGTVPACLDSGTCRGVFVAGTPEDVVPVVTGLRAAGYAGPVYAGDGFDTSLLSELGGKASPGIFFSTHVAYDSPRAQVRAFVEEWTAANGEKPTSAFAALGYDAVGLVADAVRRCGSAEPAQVRAALAATRGYAGVTGDITYPGSFKAPSKPVTIVRFAGGRRTFEAEVLP